MICTDEGLFALPRRHDLRDGGATKDLEFTSPARLSVDRLGVPQWMWLTETNTGVNSACMAKDRCSTTFSGPMGMAASFNRSSWRAKGSVMGTEMRALTNAHWHRDAGVAAKALIGVTGFGPNINQQRDPRFGRSSELPGEDPFVAGTYAAEMMLGMQEQDAAGHPKMLAYLKQ